ncbi:MAG: radical SAM protein [Candidatus ainarchaeum sp.]|nr:radical SAM protein [Candidatus ainarchaeum sp.]
MQNLFIPKGFIFQWHITERCNLKCKHCYQDSILSKELSFEKLVEILNQIEKATDFWKSKRPIEFRNKFRPNITLTGGEPFIREDIFDLLDEIKKRNKFRIAILSNGIMITKEIAKKLKKYNLDFFQISLDGLEETHDLIRGKGNFKNAINGIKLLTKEKIPVMISFTANKKNYKEITELTKLTKKLKVFKFWSDRFIPEGKGKEITDLTLNKLDTKEYCETLRLAKKETTNFFSKSNVFMQRSLQFLCGGEYYSCGAGKTVTAILPNGDLMPCRRLNLKTENLFKKPFLEIFYKNKKFKEIREEISSKLFDYVDCKNCIYFSKCKGGSKCLSYAIAKKFKKDPGCWI